MPTRSEPASSAAISRHEFHAARVLAFEPREPLRDAARGRPRARRLLLEREQVRDPHRAEHVEWQAPECEQVGADLAVRRAAQGALGVVEH